MRAPSLSLSATILPILVARALITRHNSVIGPNDPIPSLPAGNDTFNFFSLLNTTADHSTNLRVDRPICTPGVGTQLSPDSCSNAYSRMMEHLRSIDRGRGHLTIGARGTAIFDLSDPTRFLSTDGNCAFEISINKRDQRTAPAPEIVTIGEMDAAARSLKQVCVNGHPTSGGVVRGLGDDGEVTLAVAHNVNFQAQCRNPPPSGPPEASCRNLRKIMPYGIDDQGFGPHDAWPIPAIKTPYTLYSDDGRCELTIVSQSSDISWLTWKQIYEVATDIEAACAANGKLGYTEHLGGGGPSNLAVWLKDAAQPPPELATE